MMDARERKSLRKRAGLWTNEGKRGVTVGKVVIVQEDGEGEKAIFAMRSNGTKVMPLESFGVSGLEAEVYDAKGALLWRGLVGFVPRG